MQSSDIIHIVYVYLSQQVAQSTIFSHTRVAATAVSRSRSLSSQHVLQPQLMGFHPPTPKWPSGIVNVELTWRMFIQFPHNISR